MCASLGMKHAEEHCDKDSRPKPPDVVLLTRRNAICIFTDSRLLRSSRWTCQQQQFRSTTWRSVRKVFVIWNDNDGTFGFLDCALPRFVRSVYFGSPENAVGWLFGVSLALRYCVVRVHVCWNCSDMLRLGRIRNGSYSRMDCPSTVSSFHQTSTCFPS